MTRAAKVCSTPRCPNLQPCPEHAPKPWATSTRRDNLRTRSGSRQQKLRRHVLTRDDLRCHQCGHIFPERQLVCDHVIPLAEGGPDTLANMAACCTSCHTTKTLEEAARARSR